MVVTGLPSRLETDRALDARVSVRFVDFGTRETVRLSGLMFLHRRFIKLAAQVRILTAGLGIVIIAAPQAQEARLWGVEEVRGGCSRSELVTRLAGMVQQGNSAGGLYAVLRGGQWGRRAVWLVDATQGDNREVVDCGLAFSNNIKSMGNSFIFTISGREGKVMS